ncbi:MAG: TetR/AcrR family transcriptional regulator [bacterium]|nr:TetR/AcrR family transcriptional regulator [bacterium]
MRIDENIIAELVARSIIHDTFRRLPLEKRERVYQSALRLFGEYGYDGLAVDHLCRESGISKGSFFQYFPSKAHLLEFCILVFDDYLSNWVNELKQQEQAVLARDRLLYLFRALVTNSRLHAAEQKFFLFINNAMDHAGVRLENFDLERHFHEYVAEIVRRGVETREIRGDYEVELTGHLVAVVIGAMINREYRGARYTRAEMEEYLISFLFDGIKA